MVSILCGVPAYDTQCGLKILRRHAYQQIRPELRTPGFAFDVELLLFLNERGCRVIEFPIDWYDVPGSKVSLLKDSVRMAQEVLAIRRRISRTS